MTKDLVVRLFYIILSIYCARSFAVESPAPLYEQKIKAGLVYNLIKYTEWPTAPLAPSSPANSPAKINGSPATLKICLFSDDPFDGYLSPLQGRTAQQALISIVQIINISEADTCNAIIIHKNQREHLQKLFEFLQGKNILTISDIEKFAELGGMIELAREDEKVTLAINKNSVDNAKLVIDSRMLKLAKLVSKESAK